MPPVPKKKHTRARSGTRRNSPSNRGILPTMTICPSCKKIKRPHMACPHCGFYPA